MKNLLSYNEKYVEQLKKAPPTIEEEENGAPFVLYAIWSPNRQGYLSGMPLIEDDETIVRDNELDKKQIKLFITDEQAQEFIDDMINYLTYPNKMHRLMEGDLETVRKLIIVRLIPDEKNKKFFPN